MDELTRLRELRADAPAPDRAALAPGRALLTDAIAGRNRRTRRLRADWRIASLGAVVAITAAALFITQIVDATAPRHGHLAARTHGPDLSSPAAALGQAADFLERQKTPPEPRPDQWVYKREVGGTVTTRRSLYSRPGPPPPTNMVRSAQDTPQDTWTKYDDKALEKAPNISHPYTPSQLHRIAGALPKAPQDLLAELRRLNPTNEEIFAGADSKDDRSFRTALALLEESYAVPPNALARVYQALATVEGVKVIDHLVRDASGREVIAVTRDMVPSKSRLEIFINPKDYSYAGYREVTTETHKIHHGGVHPSQTQYRGDVLNDLARIDTAIVDADREMP
ncbi:CU044_5270 family protein [Streptomyces anulatus]|uniref:CU044_5270 family protein n=1 Tax=Streptomyces TaxID=1883 RepID=UPI0009389485|nr:CU044_5270 family protein [Streptomyces sp. TSRI0395]OKI82718.1 hypothetical protein AMK12_05400 [Streptomyces sp. TSRI0395]